MKPKPSNKGKSGVREVKAWITVSDFAQTPTTYGEYFTRKMPAHYYGKIVPCTITYKLPITKKVNKKK